MKLFTHSLAAVAVVGFSAALVLTGCGVSQKKLTDAESRIQLLEQKGVPDSLITQAKVQLFNAQSSQKLGNGLLAGKQADSMMTIIKAAETYYAATVEKMKPFVDSIVASINQTKKELSGVQLNQVDSMLSIVDTLSKKSWFLQAKSMCLTLDTLMPSLLSDEKKAKEVSANLIGTWVSVHSSTEKGIDAVEKRSYSFSKDGTMLLSEERKGKSAPNLKEDWKFESTGTYALKGDTALLHITKEKCLRQVFWTLSADNKWVEEVKPTYDSTITSGSKDRTLPYNDFKADFKKK